jgi:serine-type D-Ala-D-Ala carboxypeptidase (penicillin-binding protein 5/6)
VILLVLPLLLAAAGDSLTIWHIQAGQAGSAGKHASSRGLGPRPPDLSFGSAWLASHPQPVLPITGQAAILVDPDRRQILWQRDARSRRAPASLTKLMTAMVAADLVPLDRTILVTPATDANAIQQIEPDSTVMGLTAGESLTVRELLDGLFLRSGNDAAETLAAIPGRSRFVQLMNAKAAQLGMTASHFSTPVGLDDGNLYSTAYDLALAATTIVLHYPLLLEIAGAPSATVDQTPTHQAYDMVNYNKLVVPDQPFFYSGATGMKTGSTDDAGLCLVATARRGQRRLVAVIMHGDRFFDDAHLLLDYGFAT